MNLLPGDLILVVSNAYCMYLGVVVADAPDALLYRLIERPQGRLGQARREDTFRINKGRRWENRVHPVKPEHLTSFFRIYYDRAVAEGTYTPQ